MTGNSKKSWNSTSNVVVPALLASIEATWISTWFGALAHLAPYPRVDVPFLAVAVPAAAAAAVTGSSARTALRFRVRALALAPFLFVLMGLSAGILAGLYLHASFGSVVVNPFGERGVIDTAASSLAWSIAAVAVLRGAWLGWRELSLRHVIDSLLVSMLAFVAFFVVAVARQHELSFHAELTPAVVLLLIAFPSAIAVAAVVNERDLERNSRLEHFARPSAAWLASVMVPMAAVAAIGILLTYGVGPLVPIVGRLLGAFLAWLVSVVGAVLAWIGPLVHLRARALPRALGAGSGTPRLTRGSGAAPIWVTIVSVTAVALVIAALLVLLLRLLRRLFQQRIELRRPVETVVTSERDSVFSWAHLLDQIWLWLSRRWRRSSDVMSTFTSPAPPDLGVDLRTRSVRLLYLRVLVAARAAGRGRGTAETPLEFARRLSDVIDDIEGEALAELTSVYGRARYGHQVVRDAEIDRASIDAQVLLEALLPHPEKS